MKSLKDAEKTELAAKMSELTPDIASLRRMAAFSHAENSRNHEWHTDPFTCADHILFWMVTGNTSDGMRDERRDREAL